MAYLTRTGIRQPFVITGRGVGVPNGVSQFRGHRKLRGLAAISPQDAVNQIILPSQYAGAKMVPAETAAVLDAATTGQIPWGPSNWATGFNCSSTSSPSGAQIIGMAGGLGVSIGGAVATHLATIGAISLSVPVVGLVAAAAEAIVGLFVAIFQHHAQAVAKEEQVLCASVPAANDSLTAIEQAVANGTITPADGIASLQQLQQEFAQAVSSIIKDDQSHCNAACVWTMCLAAACLTVGSQWQDQINAAQQAASAAAANQPAPASTSVVTISPNGAAVASTPAASTTSDVSEWFPYAAAAALLFLVLR